MKTLLVIAVLLIAADAHAAYSLRDAFLSGERTKLERCVRRCERIYPQPSPAIPDPTRSPTPTAVADCSDGTFSLVHGTHVMQWLNRTYEPGRPYHLCATLDMPAGRPLGLSSRNYANFQCNDLRIRLVAPSGAEYTTGSPQPGVGAKGEPGKWALTVRLEPDPASLCRENRAFDLFLSWY